jgi:hypothetical protein
MSIPAQTQKQETVNGGNTNTNSVESDCLHIIKTNGRCTEFRNSDPTQKFCIWLIVNLIRWIIQSLFKEIVILKS